MKRTEKGKMQQSAHEFNLNLRPNTKQREGGRGGGEGKEREGMESKRKGMVGNDPSANSL